MKTSPDLKGMIPALCFLYGNCSVQTAGLSPHKGERQMSYLSKVISSEIPLLPSLPSSENTVYLYDLVVLISRFSDLARHSITSSRVASRLSFVIRSILPKPRFHLQRKKFYKSASSSSGRATLAAFFISSSYCFINSGSTCTVGGASEISATNS